MQHAQMEHPQIKGHMVNIIVEQPKQTTAQARAFRKSLRDKRKGEKYSPQEESKAKRMQHGAALILGLCSSHIYATKPD